MTGPTSESKSALQEEIGSIKEDIQTIEAVYRVAKRNYDWVLELESSHQQRAAVIFSFGGVILSIAFYAHLSGELFFPLFVVGVSFIFAGLLLSLLAITTWEVQGPPQPRVLAERYMKLHYERFLKQVVIPTFIQAFEHNKRTVNMRGYLVDWGFFCVIVALLFFVLSAFFN